MTNAGSLHYGFAGFWRPVAAGACGSVAHSALMFLQSRTGLVPEFQPYDDLQTAMSALLGTQIPPFTSWALSFVNGALILGFLFGRSYRLLPGKNGVTKGLIFGLMGWVAMGLLFFPALGRGVFAAKLGLGPVPALLSLAMVLAYSVVLGIAYSALMPDATRRSFMR